jgi:hypothetical protein
MWAGEEALDATLLDAMTVTWLRKLFTEACVLMPRAYKARLGPATSLSESHRAQFSCANAQDISHAPSPPVPSF